MIPDPGEGARVQHLQQQRADTADHHRGEIAMHGPCDRARPEQTRVPGGPIQIDLARAESHDAMDLLFDRLTDTAHWQ